jgi:carotenoid 1,2-hydratase
VSDCGTHAVTVIAFVGSVFSPYYYWARQRALRGGPPADPQHYCAINVAIYSPGKKRWTMTERGRSQVRREARRFVVGPSSLNWNSGLLTLDLNERSAPIPFAVRGQIRLRPHALFNWQRPLDTMGRHRWGPIATQARIEVEFEQPDVRWSGHGYLDSNEGDEPIENRFDEWDWSRTLLPDGDSTLLYDVRETGGNERLLALRFGHDGRVTPFDPGPRQALSRSAWGVKRSMRSEPSPVAPRIIRTLEDTPFYARSLAQSVVDGQPALAMHETLNGPRLRSPVVRWMLPWRMSRLP